MALTNLDIILKNCVAQLSKTNSKWHTKYIFGSGSGENFLPSITGKFYDKVIELCNLLNVTPRTNFTEENAGIHNVGDGGLDWVGVFNFPDNQFSQPTFLANVLVELTGLVKNLTLTVRNGINTYSLKMAIWLIILCLDIYVTNR